MTLTRTPGQIVAEAAVSGKNGLLGIHPSWERVALGDVADVLNGAPFSSKYFNTQGDGLSLIRIRDVGANNPTTYYEGPYDPAYIIKPGDILVGMDGDFRVAEWRGPKSLLNQRVCKITVSNEHCYSSKFLRLVLQGYLDAIWSETSSITVKHLSSRSIAEIPLPLPPIAEQRRIVAALEGHLSHVDVGLSSIQRAYRRTRRLRLAALRHYLRGAGIPTNLSLGTADDVLATARGEPGFEPDEQAWEIPDTWRWASIGQLFRVFVGSTPKRSMDKFWGGSISWVSSGEVSFCRIRETRESISDEALGNRATRYHPPGTVLLAMIGEGKTRGQAAILNIHAAHNQNCASIRVSETAMLPEYVYAVLEERYEDTRRSSSGGNQPALNSSKVKEIPVPVPPPATQRVIVDNLQELSENGDRLVRELRLAEGRAKTLRRALLANAFAGRLVPQDPNDEAASMLLERLRAERVAQLKPRRTRRILQPMITQDIPL